MCRSPAPQIIVANEDKESLLVNDEDATILILGHHLRRATRDKLRARGEWPRNVIVAGKSYILRADMAAFRKRLEERRDAPDDGKAARQERARKAIRARWDRRRARGAAVADPATISA